MLGGGGEGGVGGGISTKGFFTPCKRVSTLHAQPVKLVTLILNGSVHMYCTQGIFSVRINYM